jgi:hypothetical protein
MLKFVMTRLVAFELRCSQPMDPVREEQRFLRTGCWLGNACRRSHSFGVTQTFTTLVTVVAIRGRVRALPG